MPWNLYPSHWILFKIKVRYSERFIFWLEFILIWHFEAYGGYRCQIDTSFVVAWLNLLWVYHVRGFNFFNCLQNEQSFHLVLFWHGAPYLVRSTVFVFVMSLVRGLYIRDNPFFISIYKPTCPRSSHLLSCLDFFVNLYTSHPDILIFSLFEAFPYNDSCEPFIFRVELDAPMWKNDAWAITSAQNLSFMSASLINVHVLFINVLFTRSATLLDCGVYSKGVVKVIVLDTNCLQSAKTLEALA